MATKLITADVAAATLPLQVRPVMRLRRWKFDRMRHPRDSVAGAYERAGRNIRSHVSQPGEGAAIVCIDARTSSLVRSP